MKTYLEAEEVKSLEGAAGNIRDKLLIRLLFRLGCRVSEALALQVEDIDFNRRCVTIKHLKRRLNLLCPHCGSGVASSHIFCPRCGDEVEEALVQQRDHHRQRVLPLDRETLGILLRFIRRGGPVLRDGKRLIFGINRHRAWQIIKECAESAGLPNMVNPDTGKARGVSPHRLRDAFAVHAVKLDDSGDGLRLLQEHLGHASFNTTAKYRKVSGKEHRQWYDRLWMEDKSIG